MENYYREQILNRLRSHRYPMTVGTVAKLITQGTGCPCGWNTIRRYMDKLAEQGVVRRQALPSGANRKPLVVYYAEKTAIQD